MVPFPTAAIPDPPAIYADLKREKPDAVILEAPLFDSTKGQTFSSLWGYWQQRTGLATSGGYPGLTNRQFDAEVAQPSVFSAARMNSGTQSGDCERDGILDIRDRAWLELTVAGFDYAILHHGPATHFDDGLRITYLRNQLIEGVVHSSPTETVVALDRLTAPRQLIWRTDQGWRPMPAPRDGSPQHWAALRSSRIVVYQPKPGGRVEFDAARGRGLWPISGRPRG